ncbi:MAG TPA: hypothetical protein PK783_07425, partial [Chitinophagales bacterium]|nr:hypothetical protein [Chitinophagales bacterium]
MNDEIQNNLNTLENKKLQLLNQYIETLEENGEPNEIYKYVAINTFQQNWDLDASDFYQMLKKSLSKVSNLLYQNSRGFIEKSAQLFPEDTRAMFKKLYDESIPIAQRINAFQNDA